MTLNASDSVLEFLQQGGKLVFPSGYELQGRPKFQDIHHLVPRNSLVPSTRGNGTSLLTEDGLGEALRAAQAFVSPEVPAEFEHLFAPLQKQSAYDL